MTRIARPKNNGHVMLQPGQAQRPAGRGTFMARKWASAKGAIGDALCICLAGACCRLRLHAGMRIFRARCQLM